jgi:murein tripeptide amidase MpaA
MTKAAVLSGTPKIYAYYRALAAATPRVKVDVIGTTEEGRDILLVFVGNEEARPTTPASRPSRPRTGGSTSSTTTTATACSASSPSPAPPRTRS